MAPYMCTISIKKIKPAAINLHSAKEDKLCAKTPLVGVVVMCQIPPNKPPCC